MPPRYGCGMNGSKPRNVAGYFLIGLVNNIGFVIMIAGAKNIAEAGVALVYLANIVPTALVKVTAPLWFDRVSYRVRLVASALIMASSFLCVALTGSTGLQLVGVALGSLSCGLGEASFLAMVHYFDGAATMLAAWSSGTGLAGILGYVWVILINVALGASFEITILVALVWPALWIVVFFMLMDMPAPLRNWLVNGPTGEGDGGRAGSCRQQATPLLTEPDDKEEQEQQQHEEEQQQHEQRRDERATGAPRAVTALASAIIVSHGTINGGKGAGDEDAGDELAAEKRLVRQRPARLSCAARGRVLLSLWRYMVPLVVVYFAEYAMQSGAWSAIGFPVRDEAARKLFYLQTNLAYQVGVFVSRSSTFLVRATLAAVWVAPALQVVLLLFFVSDAAVHFFYVQWALVGLGFVSGLFGGFVYVNAFTLIATTVSDDVREFSLSAASMGDSFGIIASDICSLWIQSCLYAVNGIFNNASEGGVTCPFNLTNTSGTWQ
jgi:battenin